MSLPRCHYRQQRERVAVVTLGNISGEPEPQGTVPGLTTLREAGYPWPGEGAAPLGVPAWETKRRLSDKHTQAFRTVEPDSAPSEQLLSALSRTAQRGGGAPPSVARAGKQPEGLRAQRAGPGFFAPPAGRACDTPSARFPRRVRRTLRSKQGCPAGCRQGCASPREDTPSSVCRRGRSKERSRARV